jgi:hypothetical protein
MPPPLIKEEIPEDSDSSPRCHEALIQSDQKKEDASSPLKTEKIEKTAEDEAIPFFYEETIAEKAEQMVPVIPIREERIKVKTFKIDQNSFSIEWNV